MELRRDIQSDREVQNQKYRGAGRGDQLQEEDGREMDDRLVSVEDQLDKGVSHRRPVSDTRVQADLRHSAEWKEEGPLLSRDERFYRMRDPHYCYTGIIFFARDRDEISFVRGGKDPFSYEFYEKLCNL